MSPLNKIFWFLFWLIIIGFSLFFYVRTFTDYANGMIPENFKLGFWESKIWFIGHIAGASASLLLGPAQFSGYIRTKYVRYHRIAGKIFIIGSLIAAVCAFRIGLIYDCKPCRISLGILAIVWFFLHRSCMVGNYTQKHKSTSPVYDEELYCSFGIRVYTYFLSDRV